MKVKNYDITERNQVMSMLQAGMTQCAVAGRFGTSARTVRRWWHKFTAAGSVDDRPRSGRPSAISNMAKIVLKKAAEKRGRSAMKIFTQHTQ